MIPEQNGLVPQTEAPLKKRSQSLNARSSRKGRATADSSVLDATSQEIGAIVSTIDEGLTQYEERTANEIVDRIRETPNNLITKVNELASEEVADPEFFRESATNWLKGLGI